MWEVLLKLSFAPGTDKLWNINTGEIKLYFNKKILNIAAPILSVYLCKILV